MTGCSREVLWNSAESVGRSVIAAQVSYTKMKAASPIHPRTTHDREYRTMFAISCSHSIAGMSGRPACS